MLGSWDPKKPVPCQSRWNLQLAIWCWILWFVLLPFPQWCYSPFCTASAPSDPYWLTPECHILTVPGNYQCAVSLPVLTVLLIAEFAVCSNPWKLWTVWWAELLWLLHVGSCDLMLGSTSVFNCILLSQHYSTTLFCGLHSQSKFSTGSNYWK